MLRPARHHGKGRKDDNGHHDPRQLGRGLNGRVQRRPHDDVDKGHRHHQKQGRHRQHQRGHGGVSGETYQLGHAPALGQKGPGSKPGAMETRRIQRARFIVKPQEPPLAISAFTIS